MLLVRLLRLSAAGFFACLLPISLAESAALARNTTPESQNAQISQAAPTVIAKKTTTNSKKPGKQRTKRSKLRKYQSRKIKYSFKCMNNATSLVTVKGKKRVGKPVPFILWTPEGSSNFADQYTPEARCNTVTSKFNQNFISKGKKRVPALTIGQVNRLPVACVGRNGSCTGDILWTLKPENAAHGSQVLAQIKAMLRGQASAGPIVESDEEEEMVELESEDSNEVDMDEGINTVMLAQIESEDPELAEELREEDAVLESEDEEEVELESDDVEETEEL